MISIRYFRRDGIDQEIKDLTLVQRSIGRRIATLFEKYGLYLIEYNLPDNFKVNSDESDISSNKNIIGNASINTYYIRLYADAATWYKRFGYLGKDRLEKIVIYFTGTRIKGIPTQVYEPYALAKAKEVISRLLYTDKTTEPFERFIFNTFYFNESFKGYNYTHQFIYEYSSLPLIRFIKNKYDIVDNFFNTINYI